MQAPFLRPLLALLSALCLSAMPASAQWTAADAQTAFSAYNNAFLFNPSGDNYDYRTSQGSTNTSGFWVGAEEIELALDAYNQNPTPGNLTLITQLTNGFTAQFTTDWSSDTFDDDLMWAVIAFTRAAKATGSTALLTEAENNFNTVWSRGHDNAFGGGIWWDVSAKNTPSGYKNSAANWPFVIAGNLLFQATGNSTYASEAASVYAWATSTIYVPATGEVYDGINASGLQTGQYSYNYGTAIGADTYQQQPAAANNKAMYLIRNVTGGSVNGINILPSASQGGGDGSGFDGITLRWIGYAIKNGTLTSPGILSWAQTNVGLGWAERNPAALSWDNFFVFTPAGGLYSWDCSDTLAGLLDIPVPTPATSGFTLATSTPEIMLSPGQSGSSTIAVTPGANFPGPVLLTASVINAPTGISASLSQNSVTDGGSVTLMINTTTGVQGGNYLVAVTGTGTGGMAQTVYVQVGLPFYTLSATPSTVSLEQVGTASMAVTVIPQNGFSGNVQLGIGSGLPYGVLPVLEQANGTSGSTLQLVALSSAFTSSGTPVTITGTSPGYAASTSATLTVSAASLRSGIGVPVDLSTTYNLAGATPDGTSFTNGGLDGGGTAYSSNLLGAARALRGVRFRFGPSDGLNAIYGAGQTVALPAGKFTTLQLMGTGINGEQKAQSFTVTYTDGSVSTFAQGFSDWFSPSLHPNESEALAMTHRNTSNGTADGRQFNAYGYTYLLDSTKTVKSLTFPNNRNVVILAATLASPVLTQPVNIGASFNTVGIVFDGSHFASNGGLDGGGTAYSGSELAETVGLTTIMVNGNPFRLASPGSKSAIAADGQTVAIYAGNYTVLHMLGTGVEGSQPAQTIQIHYTDGTTDTVQQGFSDWFSPQQYPGETRGVQMSYRDTANGTQNTGSLNLYEYNLPLNYKKAVQTITLPTNMHVLVLAITLANN